MTLAEDPDPSEAQDQLAAFLRSQGPDGLVVHCAMQGDLHSLQQLVTLGASPLGFQDRALEMAIQSEKPGCFEVVQWLASLDETQVSARVKSQALGAAALVGNITGVRLLHQSGADARDNDDYAFRRASEMGHLGVAKWLFHNAGADVQAKDNYAIGLAAQNGHIETCQWLVSEGADVTADDSYALTYAARYGFLDLVHWLIGRGCNCTAADHLAVRFAAGNGHCEVVEALVEAGASADMAMQEAVEGKHLAVCKWLQVQSHEIRRCRVGPDNAQESGVFLSPLTDECRNRIVHPLLAAASCVFLNAPRGQRSLEAVHDGRGLFREFVSTFRNVDALSAGYDITGTDTESTFPWPERSMDDPIQIYPR